MYCGLYYKNASAHFHLMFQCLMYAHIKNRIKYYKKTSCQLQEKLPLNTWHLKRAHSDRGTIYDRISTYSQIFTPVEYMCLV